MGRSTRLKQGMQRNLLSPPQVSSQGNCAGQQRDGGEWEVGGSQLAEGLQGKPLPPHSTPPSTAAQARKLAGTSQKRGVKRAGSGLPVGGYA